MLLDEIVGSIPLPSKETEFRQPPKGSFVVWMDSVERGGADVTNLVSRHSSTIELYSDFRDAGSKAAIEQELDRNALEWERGETVWIQSEKLYMTPYYFEYTEKE